MKIILSAVFCIWSVYGARLVPRMVQDTFAIAIAAIAVWTKYLGEIIFILYE